MFERFGNSAKKYFCLYSSVHIQNNSSVLIDNCTGIGEYNDVLVQVDSGKLRIKIWGKGLRADDYRSGGLEVHGKIEQIEFIERSGRHDKIRSDKRLREDQCER